MRVVTLSILLTLASCGGRNTDQIYVPLAFKNKLGLGLIAEKPLLVSFGAGWCKPCRKEIALFNNMQKENAEKLEVIGFLVEGNEYGAPPKDEDVADFVDKDGTRDYRLLLDENWDVFNSFLPPEGKRLPFIVLIKRDLTVAAALQTAVSSGDEGTFQNWVRETLEIEGTDANSKPTDEPTTTPEPTPPVTEIPVPPAPTQVEVQPRPDQVGKTFDIVAWTKLFGANATSIQSAFELSWKTALEENYFTEEEMPFASGQLKFVSDGGDGITQTTWTKRLEDSMCIVEMESTMRGKFIRSTSQCIIIKENP